MSIATIASLSSAGTTTAASDTGTIVPRLPFGDWVASFVDWATDAWAPFFDFVKAVLEGAYDGVAWVFETPSFVVIAFVLAVIGYFASGVRLAVGTAVGLVVIAGLDQWDHSMETLSLVILASLIALLIGIPLGVWAARNDNVSRAVRPVLDFMQTMPAFVYLIPTVVIFLTGVVPGIVATVVFAAAPGVRFTELGIRGVDKEVVEAGHAFGSTSRRILRQIQIPLAMPTIMAGVNQVIMLALSMVVVAGLVGGGGLGGDVVAGLSQVDVALGFEAGLSVVIIAMFLDRVTSALADRSPVARALAASNA
ncbi:proline/glycine betaine ABC transporter permease [Cellulomonas sp. PhB143]|uniref:ABC transporter permease n=1 Tax=Cellulomonas sp. PhB143 TaxID=2485186 RepID=UPI000F462B07|nr:ABC transporter permease subunit [Cellulomonas sp. PhB143]ROS78530.1 glycine betaine/proline transport system permease protein [Cellulomonas sp. PhB143]